MSFSNARISTKLISAFAVILSVFTLASVSVFVSLNATLEASRMNTLSYENIQDVDGVLYAAVEQQNALRGLAATGDPSFFDTYEKSGALLDRHLADFRRRTSRADQQARPMT